MPVRKTKSSIENIRRKDLIEAAYLTFLEYGLSGMTMARIGERADMSHGIVNYYFKSKDALLSAVVRKGIFLIIQETARCLRLAQTPRERISAIIAANFMEDLFTRDTARAWVSYYAAIRQHPEFERLQNAVDRRVISNLMHDLRGLTTPDRARQTAFGVALLIDGLWLRRARMIEGISSEVAVGQIEAYVDHQIAGTTPDGRA